jgi:hypothetical protein
MTLPLAQKDISVHPTHASVVDPLNEAEASHDVETKVSIYLAHWFTSLFNLSLDYVVWRRGGF